MSHTLELHFTGESAPTWVTGVTAIHYREHDHRTAARYEALPEGGYDPTALVIDPRRFVSLRLVPDAELACLRDATRTAADVLADGWQDGDDFEISFTITTSEQPPAEVDVTVYTADGHTEQFPGVSHERARELELTLGSSPNIARIDVDRAG